MATVQFIDDIKIEDGIPITLPEIDLENPVIKQEVHANEDATIVIETFLPAQKQNHEDSFDPLEHKTDLQGSTEKQQPKRGPKTKKYECEVCNKTFTNEKRRDEHIFLHTGEKQFSCEICFKRFPLKRRKDLHMVSHSKEKPYVCKEENCGKGFKRPNDLKQHIDLHAAKFKCDSCGQKFITNYNLVRHMSLHTNERPYKCDICFKTFRFKSSLSGHIVTHIGTRSLSCEFCLREFTVKACLEKHIKDNHVNSEKTVL